MEAMVRFGAFVAIFLAMVAWEALTPARRLSQARLHRWSVNLGLAALNVALMRVSLGAAAWLAAGWAGEHRVGLFNLLALPGWLELAPSLLLLDLAIYAQHVAAHRWRWFWRLHQVHHTDIDFDASTAVRFHPLEILLSMLYKVALVIVLGIAPAWVIAFETILNGCALFNHGNVSLPAPLERYLRFVLITPDLHRIHHSAYRPETDSNYGFSLCWWDRLFKTYCPRTRQAQAEMHIGLDGFRDPCELGFVKLLALPFRTARDR